jgi:hypothetical protein
MQKVRLLSLLAGSVLLASCGGGGGGGDAPAPATLAVDVSGTAAKGRVANALVTVHGVNADGSVSTAALASGVTDAQGNYRIKFTGNPSQAYVLQVRGQNGTTHLDEVTQQAQVLPSQFRMRSSLVLSGSAVDFRSNVTPFSEMAVAAAEKASGGLTPTNIASGVSAVRQMLGFNPAAVEVKTTADATNPDEQKLALLLTAVSQMANSGAAGCTGDAGARTACVVDALGSAASVSTGQLKTANVDVGAALAAAATTVLNTPALAGKVTPAALSTVLANLTCTQACAPAPATPSLPPIAAAKDLFAEIKSDWNALFVSGATAGVGDARAQASKFEDAMRDVQLPAELLIKDSTALLLGIDLYNDYKAGRTTSNSRGRLPNAFSSTGPEFSTISATGCTLYQDSNATTTATAPANARFIGCSARYYFDFNTGAEWSHGFLITPSATTGEFTYGVRARTRRNGVTSTLPTGSTPAVTGTVRVTADSAGEITAFNLSGNLPAAFEMGGTALVDDHQEWTLAGTRAVGANNQPTNTVQGQIVSKDAAGAVRGTLVVRSASLREIPVSWTAAGEVVAPNHPQAVTSGGFEVGEGSLDVAWTTAGASFNGTLTASGSAWTKNLAAHVPTHWALQGQLATITGGSSSEFLAGTATVDLAGVEAFDDQQPTTASNSVRIDLAATANVTAPGRPLLAFSLGTSMRSNESNPSLATLQLRAIVAGATRKALLVTATSPATGLSAITLEDAANNLSIRVVDGAASADLLLNGSTVIGRLDTKSGVLTYTDGTFMSVDFGQ